MAMGLNHCWRSKAIVKLPSPLPAHKIHHGSNLLKLYMFDEDAAAEIFTFLWHW